MKLDPHFDTLKESHLIISKNTVTQNIQDSTLSHDHEIDIYMMILKNHTTECFPGLLSKILAIS